MKFKIFSVSHPQHPQQAPILFLDMCSAHLDFIDNGDMEGLPHSGNITLKSNRHLKKLGSCYFFFRFETYPFWAPVSFSFFQSLSLGVLMGLETTASYHGKLGRVSILWGL